MYDFQVEDVYQEIKNITKSMESINKSVQKMQDEKLTHDGKMYENTLAIVLKV